MRRFAFRRTAVVGAIWMGLLGLVAAISAPASGQEADAVTPGKGDAYAQGVKLDPRTASLSIGLTFGETLSGHQNLLAIAESKSLNLGIIGTILAGEGCDGGDPTLPAEDQPQPLVARTDEDGGEASDSELGVSRRVSVNDTPLAVAESIVDGGLGALGISASKTETQSGVVDGRRFARAVSTIGSIDLLGILELEGLRWVAEYQTEPEEATITDFSIEGISVAGFNPVDELLDRIDTVRDLGLPGLDLLLAQLGDLIRGLLGDGPTTVLDTLEDVNGVLDLIGLRITPPKAFVEEGIAFVEPLRISVIPNDARDEVLGAILSEFQPTREQLTAALFELDCSTQTVITVADILIGSLSGAGSLNIELGGVTATSGDFDVFDLNFDLPAAPAPAPPPPPPAPPAAFQPDLTPAPSVVETPSTTVADDDDDEVAAPVAESRPLSGVRGGPLMYTGLAGLLLLGLLAEADRRKMRKAQALPAAPAGTGG